MTKTNGFFVIMLGLMTLPSAFAKTEQPTFKSGEAHVSAHSDLNGWALIVTGNAAKEIFNNLESFPTDSVTVKRGGNMWCFETTKIEKKKPVTSYKCNMVFSKQGFAEQTSE